MKVAIYARVSTDAQEREGTSLGSQLEACSAFAGARGWQVVARIRDTASGFQLERPGLDDLRALVRKREIDVVLAYAVDRLSRNQNHIGVLFDELSSQGLRLEFATEAFEDTAVGRFILAARAFVAEIEREKIRERTMRGKAARARSGRMPQGTGIGTYGYRYNVESGRREPHEFQAAVVRRIFEEFAAGASIIGIANRLNDEGIPTFTGKSWHSATIFHLLQNSSYAGRTIYRRTEVQARRDPRTGKRRRHVAVRSEEEWIEVEGATEPIVSQALFDDAQARLRDPERLKMGRRSSTYALAGRVRCAACGCSMVGQTLQGSYRYYRCRRAFSGPRHDRCDSRYVRADALERAVVDSVTEVLSRPDVVVAEIERRRAARALTLAPPPARAQALEEERKRVLKLYQLGEIDDGYLEEELSRIRRERLRPAVHASPPSVADSDIDVNAVLKGVRDWLQQNASSDVNLIAQALALTVSATRDEAEIAGEIPVFTHHCTNIGITTCT